MSLNQSVAVPPNVPTEVSAWLEIDSAKGISLLARLTPEQIDSVKYFLANSHNDMVGVTGISVSLDAHDALFT